MNTDKNTPTGDQNNIENLSGPLKNIVENLQWYGQSSIRIPFDNKLIYIDPYQLTDNEQADLVLITHPHFDHFTIEEINKIANHHTLICAPKECCEKLQSQGYTNCIEVLPAQSLSFETIIPKLSIETVPAYNTTKPNHPKDKNWVGYNLNLDGVKIYHPGDTNRIPEMKTFTCDLAFMPLGQTYTMQNVEEAANAILDVQAKVAIPIHYGIYEGDEESALQLKKLLTGKLITVIKEPKTKLQAIH